VNRNRLCLLAVIGILVSATVTGAAAMGGAFSAPALPVSGHVPADATLPSSVAAGSAAMTGEPAAPPGTPASETPVTGTSEVGTGGTTTKQAAVGSSPASNPGDLPAVAALGALFSDGVHFCSGSVVHSPAGDLVLTAAHCVHDGAGGGYRTDLAFVPGYHDGAGPYGVWTVDHITVPSGWTTASDPDLDVAFVTVRQAGNPMSIESLTGANQVGFLRGFINEVTLAGYPDTADAVVTCQNTTSRQDTYQLRVGCAGFPAGTSGAPWVVNVDPASKLGTVVGVIGGYEEGGDSDVCYSSYFDDDIESLYKASLTT
jgi:V8-like Glu-specific endopeptidase